MRHTSYITIALLSCLCASAHADKLTVKKTVHEGHFLGIEKDTFMLRTEDGKTVSVPCKDVTTLTLDKGRRARMQESGKSKTSTVVVESYKKPQIAFTLDGRRTKIFASRITNLKVLDVPTPEGEIVAGGGDGAPEPQIMVDVAAIEAIPDQTPAQQAALQGYKTAKAQYDQFVADSSRLVKTMDSMQGAQREKALVELQHRKNQEQPLKNAYRAALANLMKQFPPQ